MAESGRILNQSDDLREATVRLCMRDELCFPAITCTAMCERESHTQAEQKSRGLKASNVLRLEIAENWIDIGTALPDGNIRQLKRERLKHSRGKIHAGISATRIY